MWAAQRLHINPPSGLARFLNNTGWGSLSVLCFRLIGVGWSAGGLIRRWEKPSHLHRVATARLKLGSPWSERCHPAMACSLLVRRAEGTSLTSKSQFRTRKTKENNNNEDSNSSYRKVERSHHVPRTLCWFSAEDDFGKTVIINKELTRLNIGIACLQETRLADNGSLRESRYTFLWQGFFPGRAEAAWLGFAVRNSLLATIETPTVGSERIIALRMETSIGFANFLSVYAPTLMFSQEVKDKFYETLEEKVSQIPRYESLYLLGDFNARVGSDWQAWLTCLGYFGVGKLNENGQRLLELCCAVATMSSASPTATSSAKTAQSVLETSPVPPLASRWPRHHQENGPQQRPSDTKLPQRTDHSLVGSKIRLKPCKIHHAKTKGSPPLQHLRHCWPSQGLELCRDHLEEAC